jgi:hypothetical protein
MVSIVELKIFAGLFGLIALGIILIILINRIRGTPKKALVNPLDTQYKDAGNGSWYECKYPWTDQQILQDSNSQRKCRASQNNINNFARNLAGTEPYYRVKDHVAYTNNDKKLSNNYNDLKPDFGAEKYWACGKNEIRTLNNVNSDNACSAKSCSLKYPNSFQGALVWGVDKIDKCYNCPQGYTKNDSETNFNKVCVQNCPSGYNKIAFTNQCYKCPSGTSWDLAKKKCIKVNKGSVSGGGLWGGALLGDFTEINPDIKNIRKTAPVLAGSKNSKAITYDMFNRAFERN